MFRSEMKSKLHRIFGMRKTTFDAPSEAFEQDTLFIDIQRVKTRVTEGRAFCHVEGALTIFSQADKLPFGFFNKQIYKAPHDLTRQFFFFEIDVDAASSPARMVNIHERRARFVYLYSGDYDPAQGELTSFEIEGGSP